MRRSFAALVILLLPSAASASALSDLAGSMTPNTFAVLHTASKMNGLLLDDLLSGTTCGNSYWPNLVYLTDVFYNNLYDTAGACGTMTSYGHNMVYDPTDRKVWFGGGEHNSEGRVISYDVGTDVWLGQGKGDKTPPSIGGHPYDNMAFAIPQRLFVYGRSQTRITYNVQTREWGTLAHPLIDDYWSPGPVEPMEYFPERNELFVASWFAGVWVYRFDSSTWTQLMSGYTNGSPSLPRDDTGQHNVLGAYSSKHKVIIWGGGYGDTTGAFLPPANRADVYRYFADGRVVEGTNAPAAFALRSHNVVADPVSGDFIFFREHVGSACDAWRYNPVTDQWSTITFGNQPTYPTYYCNGPADDPDLEAVVAAPIDEYGVIMFLDTHRKAPTVYLYKPPSTPAASTPAAPTGLTVT